MKFSWRGSWRKGELLIEAETLEELEAILSKISQRNESQTCAQVKTLPPPLLPFGIGCSDAVRMLLESDWGKQPRSMLAIKNELEDDGIYFSKGTLSGTLAFLVKKGDLQRSKSGGKWIYTIKEKQG